MATLLYSTLQLLLVRWCCSSSNRNALMPCTYCMQTEFNHLPLMTTHRGDCLCQSVGHASLLLGVCLANGLCIGAATA
jgi:hypothetical protein